MQYFIAAVGLIGVVLGTLAISQAPSAIQEVGGILMIGFGAVLMAIAALLDTIRRMFAAHFESRQDDAD